MSFWVNRRVLVTGAGGFIGSHLTERLVRAGAVVCAMVHYNSRNDWGLIELLDKDIRESITVICGDIRDPFFCREAVKNQSLVMHLAALIAIPYSYSAPAEYVYTNVVGTLNILQACRDIGVKNSSYLNQRDLWNGPVCSHRRKTPFAGAVALFSK